MEVIRKNSFSACEKQLSRQTFDETEQLRLLQAAYDHECNNSFVWCLLRFHPRFHHHILLYMLEQHTTLHDSISSISDIILRSMKECDHLLKMDRFFHLYFGVFSSCAEFHPYIQPILVEWHKIGIHNIHKLGSRTHWYQKPLRVYRQFYQV